MTKVRISEDIVPVSEFKARAAEWLRRVSEDGHPLVITQNGTPAAVVISPEEFDRLTERQRLIAAVDDGIADLLAGRVHTHEEVFSELKEHLRNLVSG